MLVLRSVIAVEQSERASGSDGKKGEGTGLDDKSKDD